MTHDFKLDTSSSKGWGNPNYDVNDPAEHGAIISDLDLKILSETYRDFSFVRSKGTINPHRIIHRIDPANISTMVIITGGESRIHAVDLAVYPEGLVFPMNLFANWPRDVNLVVIDFNHQMSWTWARNTDTFRFKGVSWEKLMGMISFNGNGPAAQLLDALHDFKLMVQQIKDMIPGSMLWALGHCNSCSFLAKYHDFFSDPTEFSGLVFASPGWWSSWKEMLADMKYFCTPVSIPLMVVQHQDDRCRITGPELARAIVEKSDAPVKKYLELEGGVNLGCPHFSMGHHAFRGIEDTLIKEIIKFIKSNTK